MEDLDLIVIVVAFFCVLSFINEIFLNKFRRYLNLDYTSFFIEKVRVYKKDKNIGYGKLYAYNPISRKVIIENKDTYTLCDYFMLNHEVEHSRDDENRVLYFNMILIAIYRLVYLPMSMILCIVDLHGVFVPKEVRYIFIVILIIFILIKLHYILKHETKASKEAYINLKEEISNNNLRIVFKFALCCIFQQILVTLLVGTFAYIIISYL